MSSEATGRAKPDGPERSCGLGSCTCTLASGESFCSPDCQEAVSSEGGATAGPCPCGHAECEASVPATDADPRHASGAGSNPGSSR